MDFFDNIHNNIYVAYDPHPGPSHGYPFGLLVRSMAGPATSWKHNENMK